MTIADLVASDEKTIRSIAVFLIPAFAHIPGCMKTLDAALAEIRESFGVGRTSRVARDGDGSALGWIGGIE